MVLSGVGQAGLQVGTMYHLASLSAALGLSHQLVVRGPGGSATLGLCVGQLASAPGAHPPTRGFRLGAPLRSQVLVAS